MATVGATNVVMAFVALLCLALLTSPVLDPRRLGVNAQMTRLASGEVEPADFDYAYLRWNSGRWGELALRKLAQGRGGEHGRKIAEFARLELNKKHRWSDEADNKGEDNGILTREEARSRLQSLAANDEAPSELSNSLVDFLRSEVGRYGVHSCLYPGNGCYVWLEDLNGDTRHEALVIVMGEGHSRGGKYLLTPQESGWRLVSKVFGNASSELWVAYIRGGNVRAVSPRWPDLEVGERRHQIRDEELN
jgi:hypothetical protein